MERSVILSEGSTLRAPLAELPAEAIEARGSSTPKHVERSHLLRIFRAINGSLSLAAIRLGIARTTLNATLKKLGISRGTLAMPPVKH